MKKTFNIEDDLLKAARKASGAKTDTETIRLGLESLVRRAAIERLLRLRGSEPDAADVPRARPSAGEESVILVHTSVWIRYLANREPHASRLARLLEMDVVARHEFVYGELLIGDSAGRRKFLSDTYVDLSTAETMTHEDVVHFVKHHRFHGSGMGWIDAHLLASARAGGMPLWTADMALAAAARQIHVEYRPDD